MIEENENFEIKTFLDEFNALLNDFPIIKDKIYKIKNDKLGFAYIQYSENIYHSFFFLFD
jgi:hypothetical protein